MDFHGTLLPLRGRRGAPAPVDPVGQRTTHSSKRISPRPCRGSRKSERLASAGLASAAMGAKLLPSSETKTCGRRTHLVAGLEHHPRDGPRLSEVEKRHPRGARRSPPGLRLDRPRLRSRSELVDALRERDGQGEELLCGAHHVTRPPPRAGATKPALVQGTIEKLLDPEVGPRDEPRVAVHQGTPMRYAVEHRGRVAVSERQHHHCSGLVREPARGLARPVPDAVAERNLARLDEAGGEGQENHAAAPAGEGQPREHAEEEHGQEGEARERAHAAGTRCSWRKR
jgi:hypothetical protein